MADIGEKNYLMSGVAQESTSNEIKDLVQNIKPGDAKESSVQNIKTEINNVKNWYAKVGTGTILASKTTSTSKVGTSEGEDATITLLTVDIPESGTYQWSVNDVFGGYSKTQGDISSGSERVYVSLSRYGMRYDMNQYGNADSVISPSYSAATLSCTNGAVSKSGYFYADKGERFLLKVRSQTFTSTYPYSHISVGSAYIKYSKQIV